MFGFDKMFDFNRDGKLDSWERAAQFQFMDEMMKDDEKSILDIRLLVVHRVVICLRQWKKTHVTNYIRCIRDSSQNISPGCLYLKMLRDYLLHVVEM